MKTQIITLESYDDLISVRDRMSWAKTPRILLVWPKYEKITLRQADLKVLQRHASALGAQLGLVTRRRATRTDAEELGIPVFESTGQAQKVTWPKPRKRKVKQKAPDKTLREKQEQARVKEEAWRAHPVSRIGFFILGVVAVLSLVALFIPRAQIQLKPIIKTQSVPVPVSASRAVGEVFITGNIPALEKRITVSGEQKVLVTGEGIVPQSKAKGVVIFRNLTQNEVTIPAGTVVRSDEIRFVTTDEIVVDGGVGKTGEIDIEAVDGGIAGNLDVETINIVEGRLGLLLSVTNPEPTAGGRERASVQATDSDRARAKDLMLQSLESDARGQLLELMNPNDVMFDDTFALSQILSETYDLPSGAAGSQLTLTMQAEFVVLYASASDLTKLASLALNASLPSGYSAAPVAIAFELITEPVVADDDSVRWMIRAERKIVQQTSATRITQSIVGLGVSDAQSWLNTSFPQADPKVVLSPEWWPWVPIVPFQIEVVTR
jgi:hypothetical protein